MNSSRRRKSRYTLETAAMMVGSILDTFAETKASGVLRLDLLDRWLRAFIVHYISMMLCALVYAKQYALTHCSRIVCTYVLYVCIVCYVCTYICMCLYTPYDRVSWFVSSFSALILLLSATGTRRTILSDFCFAQCWRNWNCCHMWRIGLCLGLFFRLHDGDEKTLLTSFGELLTSNHRSDGVREIILWDDRFLLGKNRRLLDRKGQWLEKNRVQRVKMEVYI